MKNSIKKMIDEALPNYLAHKGFDKIPGLVELILEDFQYDIWVPKNREHGHFSSNVALKLHQRLKEISTILLDKE